MKKLNRDSILKFFGSPSFQTAIVNIITAVAFLFIYAALSEASPLGRYTSAAVIGVLYIAAALLINALLVVIRTRLVSGYEAQHGPLFGNMTLDFIGRLNMPVLVCDNNGKVVWYNRVLSELVPRESLHGVSFDKICALELEALINEVNGGSETQSLFGGWYDVRAYRLASQNKSYYVVVFTDRTEYKAARNELEDSEALAAYIIIDNLEELLQYKQDKYRTASADVEAVLKSWANSNGGILKEYERDKFMFLFSAKNLKSFIESKFDILDRIREIPVGEGSLPITISMGVSNTGGTLLEKERAARSALDMALQRGGDQAVVKTDAGLDFFGGRTKTIQRRTKVRSRVVANELMQLIAQSSNVLVMGHRAADFDSLGACAGIARLALHSGKTANIIANTQDPNLQKSFAKLKKIPEYADMFLDAVTAQDLIGSDTLLVIVDVNNRMQYESADIYDNAHRVAIIDHHRKTDEFKHEPLLSYIEPSASSTCELVSEILEQVLPSGVLAGDEADVMFAGILVDTKQFARNVGVRTFSAALWLRGEGANTTEAQELFRTELDELIREARFESNVVIYKGIIAISVNDADNNVPGDRIIAAKAADKLLTVEGVLASFALCRIDNVIHVSARSTGTVNVQVIVEKLGGGGHYDAAATQIRDGTMGDALKRLKEAIDSYLK